MNGREVRTLCEKQDLKRKHDVEENRGDVVGTEGSLLVREGKERAQRTGYILHLVRARGCGCARASTEASMITSLVVFPGELRKLFADFSLSLQIPKKGVERWGMLSSRCSLSSFVLFNMRMLQKKTSAEEKEGVWKSPSLS